MAGGSRFGMVESEWSKVECKRAAHRALSESVVSVMSLRRERELSGGVEPLCMCALDLLRVGRHVALQQAWSSEQAVERRGRGHGPLCACLRARRARWRWPLLLATSGIRLGVALSITFRAIILDIARSLR